MQTATTGGGVAADAHPDTTGESSAAPGSEAQRRLVVLIPVYNDWESVALLLPALDAALATVAGGHQVLLLDDGSSQPPPAALAGPFRCLERVDCLQLRRNLGHQRALAVGLSHVWEHIPCEAVLIMDGDGEDAPSDVPRLLERYHAERGRAVIFAERTRRSESTLFKVCYQLYRGVHWLLTGIPVKVGNFSVMPRVLLGQLVVVSDLWNHYAASVFKARLPHVGIPTSRARRYCGTSHMNFVALVGHGLSAMSVFAETVGVRLLLAFGGLAGLLTLLLGLVLLGGLLAGGTLTPRMLGGMAILLLILLQIGLFALLACFMTLSARQHAMFIPSRDYTPFVAGVRTLYARA